MKVLHEASAEADHTRAGGRTTGAERPADQALVGEAVIHGLRGRVSNRRLSGKLERRAIAELSKLQCRNFGPAYAAKHIGQLLGLPIGKDTMRKWMVTAGLWQKPQTAKGRVERCFATAQDRVVKGLLLARARTLAQANEYLETKFLPEWNVRFAALRYKGESLLVELCGPASCKRAEKPSSQPVRKDHNRGGRSSWMRHFPLTQSPAVWKAIQQSNSQF